MKEILRHRVIEISRCVFSFTLPTTVCEEDIWIKHLKSAGGFENLVRCGVHSHAKFIFAVQDLHGLDYFWNGISTADEYAIDVECEHKRVFRWNVS